MRQEAPTSDPDERSTGATESEYSSSGPMASGPFGASGDEGKPLEKFFDAEKDADDDDILKCRQS